MARWLRPVILLALGAMILGACGTAAAGQGSNVAATQTRGVELTQVASLQATVGAPTAIATAQPAFVAPSPDGAVKLDPRLLASDPQRYVGANFYLQGQASTVSQENGYTWVQLLAHPPGKLYITESIVFEVSPPITMVRENCYRIYGVGQGTQKVTRTLTGASNSVPLVRGYMVQTSLDDGLSGCLPPSE
jgi:hypothetical protein